MWIKNIFGELINVKYIIALGVLKESKAIFIKVSGSDRQFEYYYESAERCQEIIDEIQSHIEFVEYTKNYNTATNYKNDWESIQTYKIVYEMPKE